MATPFCCGAHQRRVSQVLPSPASPSYFSRVRVRAFVALVLTVCACRRGDRDAPPGAAGAPPPTGPDPIVVRLPRDGGIVRAFRYPALDSLIWRSQQPTPPLERVLAFDGENGLISFIGRNGGAGWLDLRLGTSRTATSAALSSIASVDGWSIYGTNDANALVRLTPTGDWERPVEGKVRRLVPLADGTLLVLLDRGERALMIRLRPPDDALDDSLEVPRPERAVATPMGDRLYLSVKRELLSVQPRALGDPATLRADDEILAIAPTPSGDRIFLANKGGPRLEVVDRYAEDIQGSVRLPGLVTELRMDPMGRYLLARPVSGDSAWVVAIATETLVGTVPTQWRPDLPAVVVDGLVATVQGDDVAFVDPSDGAAKRRVEGGAADTWFFTLWNGLRPRARGLDVPVSFSLGDTSAGRARAADSIRRIPAAAPAEARDTVPAPAPVAEAPPPSPPPSRDAWTVSFAAVLSEARAREIAEGISVDGQRPRVVKGETAGTVVFRVVFGPYSSKADAERAGRASKHNYWVYEGVP